MRFKRTRRSRVKTETRKAVRLKVYERAEGRCELKIRDDCIPGVLPFTGPTVWERGHLVHRKSEGSGGKTNMENCCWGCWKCHLLGLHRGETRTTKPVPAKVERKDWTEGYYGN